MKKKILILLSYIILFLNTNLLGDENKKFLKIGLLAPLTGEYSELGNSLLYSLQLALDEINDKDVYIIPRDAGFNDEKKLETAINELKKKEVNIIIGPLTNNEFAKARKHSDVIFISPSNISPEFSQNIISVGVSLESQLVTLINFIEEQKKKKTVIMFPENGYTKFIESKLKKLDLKNIKIFKYSSDPQVLTGEIETLTNYSQRKRKLELRKKILKIKKMSSQSRN